MQFPLQITNSTVRSRNEKTKTGVSVTLWRLNVAWKPKDWMFEESREPLWYIIEVISGNTNSLRSFVNEICFCKLVKFFKEVVEKISSVQSRIDLVDCKFNTMALIAYD